MAPQGHFCKIKLFSVSYLNTLKFIVKNLITSPEDNLRYINPFNINLTNYIIKISCIRFTLLLEYNVSDSKVLTS